MERRLSGSVSVTFKRRRRSDAECAQAMYGSATQLVSIAPTQPDGAAASCLVELGPQALESAAAAGAGSAAAAGVGAGPAAWQAPPPVYSHRPPQQLAQQQQQQQAWGLGQEARFWRDLDQEALLETEEMSRQTTPGASRAASPGPCTAPQLAGADLAAVITQQLSAVEEGSQGGRSPCTEEIVRHWPRVQEQYRQYQACMAEQQLSPVALRQFFKHTTDKGVPVL